MRSPSFDVSSVGCAAASDASVSAASAKLTVPGTLRNGMMVKGEAGYHFMTAELHASGERRHDKGDLLTFARRDADATEFLAVDVNARDDSSWPDAPIDVRAQGARESRACANLMRGKTKAQIQCEQAQSSASVPLPGGKKCSDL